MNQRPATHRDAPSAYDTAAAQAGVRCIDVAALAGALARPGAPVLLDVRDASEAAPGRIAGATPLPRCRIESRIGELVRDRATPLVLCDAGGADDPRAALAAATLGRLGYRELAVLEGGVDAWRAAGRDLVEGALVEAWSGPLQRDWPVPEIDATALAAWLRDDRSVALCDVRDPDEHLAGRIPGAVSIPDLELALHAVDLGGEDVVVVHCAGRARGTVVARSLIELGLGNVVLLAGGSAGWRDDGRALERGAPRTRAAPTLASREFAELGAARLAQHAGVRRIEADALVGLLARAEANHAVFDVRDDAAYLAGHIGGCTALAGGPALHGLPESVAVRDAPVVLVDELEARANLAATWLRRMGCSDVAILAGGLRGWRAAGRPLVCGHERSRPLGLREALRASAALAAGDVGAWLSANGAARVLHVDSCETFRRGHLPGAGWLPRAWLEPRIATFVPVRETPLLLTCEDGSQAVFAAATLRERGYRELVWLDGGTQAWAAEGRALEVG